MDSRLGDEALLLLVLGLMPFAVQTDISFAGLICIFGWVFAASRAGRAAGPRPRQVANCGLVLGTAGMAGATLVAASVPMPTHSLTGTLPMAPNCWQASQWRSTRFG